MAKVVRYYQKAVDAGAPKPSPEQVAEELEITLHALHHSFGLARKAGMDV